MPPFKKSAGLSDDDLNGLYKSREDSMRQVAGSNAGSIQEGLLPKTAQAPRTYPEFNARKMIGVLAFGFSQGLLVTNFGLIILPAEGAKLYPKNPVILLGALLFISGFSQFSGPIAGFFSDRCQAAWGRRRPYLFWGMAVTLPCLGAMWVGHWYNEWTDTDPDSSAGNIAIAIYVVGFFFAMSAFNVAQQALASLISDRVAFENQGAANGILAVLLLLGSLVGFGAYFLTKTQWPTSTDYEIGRMYFVYTALLVITTGISLVCADEEKNPHTKEELKPVTISNMLEAYSLSPTTHHDFFYVTVSRMWYYCSISTMAFLQYYFRDAVCTPCGSNYVPLNISNAPGFVAGPDDWVHIKTADAIQDTVYIAIIGQVGAVLVAYPAGLISDKIGCKPMVHISCIGMACTYFLLGIFFDYKYVLPLGFMWGFFNGCFCAVDYALAIKTLPDPSQAARFLGVWGVSAFVGTTIGPVLEMVCLLTFGTIPDDYGGGDQPGNAGSSASFGTYQYSQHGFLAVMCCGGMFCMLCSYFIRFVETV